MYSMISFFISAAVFTVQVYVVRPQRSTCISLLLYAMCCDCLNSEFVPVAMLRVEHCLCSNATMLSSAAAAAAATQDRLPLSLLLRH
jgi:hypothetical protein